LLAYKDEYEVARLYSDGNFIKELKATFQGDYKLRFNLAPPIMEQNDPATGRPKKREFGAWMLPAFGLLAKFKFLRGTAFDIFGYHHDRRAERQLITQYEADIALVQSTLRKENADICAELLSVPDEIRGYGPVKEANMEKAMKKRAELRAMLENGVTRGQKKAA
jgi:indolepyruvate ferredoxin oxidoreductase